LLLFNIGWLNCIVLFMHVPNSENWQRVKQSWEINNISSSAAQFCEWNYVIVLGPIRNTTNDCQNAFSFTAWPGGSLAPGG